MGEKNMESMVQDHEKRIIELERNYSEVTKEINAVQASQSKIENMIYTQNTEQKEINQKYQKEQRDLLNTLINHTLGIRKDTNKHKWQVLAAAVGGGGFFYLLIESIFNLIGG